MLPADGVNSIGEGMLEVDEELLQGLLVKQDINEIYEVEQTPFARGKFAAVRRAIHKRSGVHFAAKFLKRRRRAQSSDKEIKHEIAVLILCSGCDNIVKLNAVHETRSDTALLLELATGGELQAILDDEGCLTEAKTRICMRQVLKALQFLHKRSIAHLDLKPQNILLTGSRVEDGLKLCDFGISRVIESGSKIREILGTPDYVAPEVLQYEPLSLLTDIWSVGVLTYVLLSGCSPFGGDTKQETFLNISQCALTFPDELFDGVSNHAIDFIKSTLRIKPNDRMSAFECLEHIWLKDESPIGGNSYLTMSRAAVDVREKNKDTSNGSSAENDYENSNNSKYQLFTQSPPISTPAAAKMHHDIDENGTKYKNSQNYTSLRSNNDIDSDEHDKENFLTNSSTNNGYSSPNNYNTNRIGSIVSNLSSKSKQITTSVSATAKLSSTPIKYGSSRFVNSDSCTLIKGLATHHHTSYHHSHRQQHHQNSHQHQNGYRTNGTSDIDVPVLNGVCGGLNKSSSSMTSTSVDAVGSSPAGQTLNKSMTAAAAICLFPDAPTTPKVIRKAPSESPKSVKALVKKFQLESGDYSPQNSSHSTNLLSMSPASNGHDDESMKKLNCQSSLSNRISPASINASSSSPSSSNGCSSTCSNSNNNNSNSNNNNISISDETTSSNGRNFKSTCVFCLSCAGPGCRHSGRGNVSKSTGTIGLDQGIIC